MSEAHHENWQLIEALRLAVPLHMLELRQLTARERAEIARACAATVASHGDDLQFGGRHARDAFNALARGLAAAALTAWGGVTFAGVHWCTVPSCPGPDADHPRYADLALPELPEAA
jgi:hypothetical protein